MAIKAGIVSDHKQINSIVVEGHNKRRAEVHKDNIKLDKMDLNYHRDLPDSKKVLDDLQEKYIKFVMRPEYKISKKEKAKKILKNELKFDEAIHGFDFQVGGEYDKNSDFNFNEYFEDVFSDEDKKQILIKFGDEFIKFVDEYSSDSKQTVTCKPVLVDFSVHLDETTPHLHMSFISATENGLINNGNFKNAFFNKKMNIFAKKRLIELTQEFANNKLNEIDQLDPKYKRLEELSEIEAKEDKKELKIKYAEKLKAEEFNAIKSGVRDEVLEDYFKVITDKHAEELEKAVKDAVAAEKAKNMKYIKVLQEQLKLQFTQKTDVQVELANSFKFKIQEQLEKMGWDPDGRTEINEDILIK